MRKARYNETTILDEVVEVSMKKEVVLGQAQLVGGQFLKQSKAWMRSVLFQYGFLIGVVGFLLGRAMILAELAPFALPYLAAIYILKRERAGLAAVTLVLGALSSYHGQAFFIVIAIFIYFLIYKIVSRYVPDSTKSLPYMVFGASMLTRIGMVFIVEGSVSQYVLMMSTVEAGLSFILTMIFLQSVPLITERRFQQPLRNEEIVCLIILLASVMTGTVGWALYDVTVEHVLARYLVLVFAFVGGAAIGSTVGVVTGLILSLASVASLYQMSLLAFSGLLGGLLKEGKRLGVSLGLLVGTLLIGLYGDGASLLSVTLVESCVRS